MEETVGENEVKRIFKDVQIAKYEHKKMMKGAKNAEEYNGV